MALALVMKPDEGVADDPVVIALARELLDDDLEMVSTDVGV